MSTPSRPTDQSSSSGKDSSPANDKKQNALLSPSLPSSISNASSSSTNKKRRVQWVGLSEKDFDEERRASVHSLQDPFQSSLDLDSPTPTPTPSTSTPGVTSFFLPAPISGIPPPRLSTAIPHLALSMPGTSPLSEVPPHSKFNPYFPPIPTATETQQQPPPTDLSNSINLNRPFRRRADPMNTPNSSRAATPDSDLDIPFGERDGLPSNPDRRPRTFTREAANLVSLHKFKLGARRRRPSFGTSQQPQASGSGAPSANALPRHGIPGGNGVLSSLLHLYNHPISAQSSSTTLITSVGSEDDSEAGSQSARTSAEKPRRLSRGWAKMAGALMNERPAAARSGAGVIGALQASAMGLGGVAAPAASTVAPVVNKTGFRVGRYSPALETPSAIPAPSDNPYEPNDEVKFQRKNSTSVDDVAILHRIASESQVNQLSPPTTGTKSQFGGIASSASSLFGVSIGGSKSHISKSGSLVNLKALGEVLDPKTYHNESAVLRAKRTAGAFSSGSTPGTPREDPFSEKEKPARQHGTRRRLEKRRQEEIFITMHVAAILQRQQFILQLTRAMMMFGGPSHRLESQIQATARVLEIDLQMVLIYSLCIFSFQDEATHTSETKFIKQSPNVDLGKLTDLAILHWEVVHDKIGVQEASAEISRLMRARPEYGTLATIGIGALCSACIGPAAFNSSFLDMLVAAPLGAGLVAAQLLIASKSDVLSQIFEIVVTGLASFIAAALASTGLFCYSAVIASSIVLILPGWLVCCAALELQSRCIVSGSVRLIWAVIYALFLGLGISVGAQFWTLFSGHDVELAVDGTCGNSHTDLWYRKTIPLWSAFIVVPGYAFFLALRQQARLNSKELWVTILLSSGGWAANHFASVAFPNRSDISSSLGSFVVGFAANIYGRMFQGTAFIVALVPILFQLPSGLGNGGLLYFANTRESTQSFTNGLSVGQQLIEVSLGLVIGLFAATVIVYPFGNRRGGLMTF